VVSRETAFLFNNLLFTAFTFVVLLGTMFPLLAEALRGAKVTVGGPYFNQMSAPIALALIFLAGIGPALPWRRGTWEQARQKFLWPGAAALAGGALCFALGVRHFLTWLTLVVAVLSAGLVLGEITGPAAARRRAHGESWWQSVVRTMTGNHRRYGGYIVHFGVLLAAVGIAVASTYKHEGEWTLARAGEAQTYGRYSMRLDSVWAAQRPHRDEVIAGVTVTKNGRVIEHMTPKLNYYPMSNEPIATPAVYEHAREDFYLVLVAYEQDGSRATIKAIVSPLVGWIWAGGILIGLGVIFGLWPRRRTATDAALASTAGTAGQNLAGAGQAR
jgi:cytochrome c-type biogenesis protein CcmF